MVTRSWTQERFMVRLHVRGLDGQPKGAPMNDIKATGTAWKFLKGTPDRIRSQHGSHVWQIGEWYSVTSRNIRACSNGFPCSSRAIDALGYVAGTVVAQVEYAGVEDREDDKSAHRHMRIVRAWNWTATD